MAWFADVTIELANGSTTEAITRDERFFEDGHDHVTFRRDGMGAHDRGKIVSLGESVEVENFDIETYETYILTPAGWSLKEVELWAERWRRRR